MDSIKPKYQRSNAETKICSKCLETKPRSEFHTNKHGTLSYICKPCAAAYKKSRYNYVPTGTYHGQPSDAETKVCSRCKQEKPIGDFYRNKNGIVRFMCKPCVTATNKEWKKANKEKVLAQPWRTSEKQRAKSRELRKVYREKYPEKIRAQKQKRRAIEMGATGSFTDKEWADLKKNFNNLCAKCGEAKPLTVDHVVPLIAGGSNSIDNIQPLCSSCNSSKGTKTIDYRK